MATTQERIKEAQDLLAAIGMPKAQANERSALTLLALLDLSANKVWSDSASPLMGITPIMDWAKAQYGKEWKPNTRETVRRQTIHQFMQAAIVVQNPDKVRPINSPDTVYQIEPDFLALAKSYGAKDYGLRLKGFKVAQTGLIEKYAKRRDMNKVPVRLKEGEEIKLSAGEHSKLIKEIVEQFAPRFIPGGELVYVDDTGNKTGYYNKELLTSLGVIIDDHGKLPDAIFYYKDKEWLVLAEAVTSHGPVDSKRHEELETLFQNTECGLVYVSTFADRKTFTRYVESISWETEVWVADNPEHLIHFNGARFLGPYEVV